MTDTLALRLREALGPDYTLERELGGAGMSRVFVATERALGRRVVVKVLPPDLAAGVNIERFRREIQLAAQLQHPHVVPLLAAGERGDLLWFTMPFIEGESLRITLERRSQLPARTVLDILHDVVDALAYAHSRGVVHRDIKPGNILMSGAHALVTDFGVAKALSVAIPMAGHTTSGMAIGTPAYMAPEQLAADPAADHRVDIYAVGLLAYELLTGSSPFSGSSPQATLAAQLTERPKAPHLAHPDVPVTLSRLILQCLEKDAAKRPATASALLELIASAEAELSGTLAAASLTRTRRGVFATAALFVAATAVFVVSRPPAVSAPAAPSRDTAPAAAETVVVYRPVPMIGDTRTSIALPLVLSPAESSAIVSAYRARGDASGPDASGPDASGPDASGPEAVAPRVAARVAARSIEIDRDSLIAAVSRVFADSMARAIARMETALAASPRQQEMQALVRDVQGLSVSASASMLSGMRSPVELPNGNVSARSEPDSMRRRSVAAASFVPPVIAPPPPGTRRLAILPYADRIEGADHAGLGDSLLTAVSEAMRSLRGGRLEIIPADASRRLLGTAPMRATSAGFALRANFVLSGVYLVRNDSLVVITALTDVQGGEETRYHLEAIPRTTASDAVIAPTAVWVRARLDSMRRAMFTRTPPPDAGRRQRQ